MESNPAHIIKVKRMKPPETCE